MSKNNIHKENLSIVHECVDIVNKDNFYEFIIDLPHEEVQKIEIDASTRMADINRSNNIWNGKTNENELPKIIFKNKL